MKSTQYGLWAGWLLSLVLFIGKTYNFELISHDQLSPYFESFDGSGYSINLIISLKDVYIGLMMIYLLLISGKQTIQWSFLKNYYLIFFNVLFIWISAGLSNFPIIGLFFALRYTEVLVVLIFTTLFKDSKKLVLFPTMILLAIAVFEGVILTGQFMQKSAFGSSLEATTEMVAFSSYDENSLYFRPFGTFLHPNIAAIYLVGLMALILPMIIQLFEKRVKLLIISVSIVCLGVVFTLSRSAWLAGLICAYLLLRWYQVKGTDLFLFLKKIDTRILSVVVLLGLSLCVYIVIPRAAASFVAFVDIEGSGTTRLKMIFEGWQSLMRRPWLGSGGNQSVVMMFFDHPQGIMYDFPAPVHMGFLHYLLEHGVFAFTFLILIIKNSLWVTIGNKREDLNMLKYGLKLLVVVFIIANIFQPFNYELWELIIVFGIIIINLEHEKNKQGVELY